MLSLPHSGARELHLADRERIFPRKDQVERRAVVADPLRRKARRLARADVPFLGEKHRRPRAPRLRGVVDAETALEAWVFPGQDLTPEVAFEGRIVTDSGAVAAAGVREDGTSLVDVFRPSRPPVLDRLKELVGVALPDWVVVTARQLHPVRSLVG